MARLDYLIVRRYRRRARSPHLLRRGRRPTHLHRCTIGRLVECQTKSQIECEIASQIACHGTAPASEKIAFTIPERYNASTAPAMFDK